MDTATNDMYQNYPSSPSRRAVSYGTQSLNRQNSRGFEPFGQQNGMYGSDEAAAGYEDQRFNDRVPAMQPNFNTFGNGMNVGWNSPGFSQNNHLASLGATGRRPGRGGRPSMPQVSLFECIALLSVVC